MAEEALTTEKNPSAITESIQISRKTRMCIAAILLLLVVVIGTIFACRETFGEIIKENPLINSADTAFVFISACLVMLMTPGLALFYGGMVRKKNVLGTMMQSFVALGVATFIWVTYGYSLAFGPDVNHLIGNLDWAMLSHVTLNPNPNYGTTIPHQLFMMFQMMFACLTPALITGAFAGRFKFKAYIMFLILWLTFIYCPLAHWVWGDGGWIKNLGGLDFAGGLVVHIGSGAAALASCLILGKRKGYKKEAMPPHNLTLTFIGAALLWLGWFGFNAGSALSAGQLAISAFTTTQIAAGMGILSWCLTEWANHGKPTVLGGISGAVAGLVAITPAAGFVTPTAAIVIGFLAGSVCYFAVNLKSKFNYDDSLDVVGIHGAGGILGSLLVGVFATVLINPDGANGLIFGSFHLLYVQIISTAASIAFSFFGTCIILKFLGMFTELRITETQEMKGLDITQHSENCYRL